VEAEIRKRKRQEEAEAEQGGGRSRVLVGDGGEERGEDLLRLPDDLELRPIIIKF